MTKKKQRKASSSVSRGPAAPRSRAVSAVNVAPTSRAPSVQHDKPLPTTTTIQPLQQSLPSRVATFDERGPPAASKTVMMPDGGGQASLYMKIQPRLRSTPFEAQPMSNRQFLRAMTDSNWYATWVIIHCLVVVYMATQNVWPSAWPSWTRVSLVITGLPYFYFELVYVDVFVFRQLTRMFTFWFVCCCIIVHAIATYLHFLHSTEHSTNDRDSTVFVSVPTFVLGYFLGVVMDAHIHRAHVSPLLKRAMLFVLTANAVRFLISQQVNFDREERASMQVCYYVYCVSTSRLRSVTTFILGLYMLRLFVLSLTGGRLLIVDLRMRYKLDLLTQPPPTTASAFTWRVPSLTPQTSADGIELSSPDNDNNNNNNGDDDDEDADISTARQLELMSVLQDTIWLRVTDDDYLLPSWRWTRMIGTSRVYPYAAALWLACLAFVSTYVFPDDVAGNPQVFFGLLNLPTLFFCVIEASTRMHKQLAMRVMQSFEFWYLQMWVVCWTIAVLLRGLYAAQEWNTSVSLYFAAWQVYLIFTASLFLDSYVKHHGQQMKRVYLVLLLIYVVYRTVQIRLAPPGAYSFCWAMCTDSTLFENSARTNIGIFLVRYVYVSFMHPQEFLMIRESAFVRVRRHPNEAANEQRTSPRAASARALPSHQNRRHPKKKIDSRDMRAKSMAPTLASSSSSAAQQQQQTGDGRLSSSSVAADMV